MKANGGRERGEGGMGCSVPEVNGVAKVTVEEGRGRGGEGVVCGRVGGVFCEVKSWGREVEAKKEIYKNNDAKKMKRNGKQKYPKTCKLIFDDEYFA